MVPVKKIGQGHMCLMFSDGRTSTICVLVCRFLPSACLLCDIHSTWNHFLCLGDNVLLETGGNEWIKAGIQLCFFWLSISLKIKKLDIQQSVTCLACVRHWLSGERHLLPDKPNDLSLIPKTHMMEGENQFLRFVFWLPHVHYDMHTCRKERREGGKEREEEGGVINKNWWFQVYLPL